MDGATGRNYSKMYINKPLHSQKNLIATKVLCIFLENEDMYFDDLLFTVETKLIKNNGVTI